MSRVGSQEVSVRWRFDVGRARLRHNALCEDMDDITSGGDRRVSKSWGGIDCVNEAV